MGPKPPTSKGRVPKISVPKFSLPRLGLRRFPPGQRKPIIYIFSPKELNVTVTLSLRSVGTRFSTIYPVVPIKYLQSGGERIEWNVRTRHDGSLTEVGTGLEVSYLFWETELASFHVTSRCGLSSLSCYFTESVKLPRYASRHSINSINSISPPVISMIRTRSSCQSST